MNPDRRRQAIDHAVRTRQAGADSRQCVAHRLQLGHDGRRIVAVEDASELLEHLRERPIRHTVAVRQATAPQNKR